MGVYEDFACNIPGFLPTSEPMPMGPMTSSAVSSVAPAVSHTTTTSAFLAKPIPIMPSASSFPSTVDEISQIYDKVVAELENYIRGTMAPNSNLQVATLHSLHEAVHLARNSREIGIAIALLQKVCESQFVLSLLVFVTKHLAVIRRVAILSGIAIVLQTLPMELLTRTFTLSLEGHTQTMDEPLHIN